MAQDLNAYDGGTWRDITTLSAYDGSTWRTITDAWVYDGSAWQKFWVTSCTGSYVLTGASIFIDGGLCAAAGGSCDTLMTIQASWTPDSACSGQHIEVALSIDGGSYSVKCDEATACDDCSDSPYNFTPSPFLYGNKNSTTCDNTCDVSCVGPTTYRWRIRLHDDGDHTNVCDEEISSLATGWYTCECTDCSGIA